MKKLQTISVLTALLLLVGCSSIPLEPNANKVLVSSHKVPKGCKYLGQVVGNQGNAFTGTYTSNRTLEQGSMNDLRNQAAKIGANYVELLTDRAGVTASGSMSDGFGSYSSQQTNVTNLGNAYLCPQSAIDSTN